jgi:hypothetical protein
MAATTAPTAKAVSYSRSQPVKRTKMPSAMPVAAPAPPHGSNARGKRPRASDGHMDLERPRRVKSSRGQKRADATGAAVSDVKPAADSKAVNGSVAQNEGGGGGAYRRVMFASFIKQAFDKRAKVCRSVLLAVDAPGPSLIVHHLHRATTRSTTRSSSSFALSYHPQAPRPPPRLLPASRPRHP